MEVLKAPIQHLHTSNVQSSLPKADLRPKDMNCPEVEKEEAGPAPIPILNTALSAHPSVQNGPKFKAYKLIVDPCFVKDKGVTKVYRFDGVVPDDPTYPPVICRDPRTSLSLSRSWNRQEPLELVVPRFKIDANYCGTPPPVEVSITNLNDNVDRAFLHDLLQKFGHLEEVQIFYHPFTSKHLGIAKVLFQNKLASKACVAKLNQTRLMGNVLNVFFDPFGHNINKLFEELLEEKKVEPPKIEEKKGADIDSKKPVRLKQRLPPTPPKISMPPPPAPGSVNSQPSTTAEQTPTTPNSTPIQLLPPTPPTPALIQSNAVYSNVTYSMSVPPHIPFSLPVNYPITSAYNPYPGQILDIKPVPSGVPLPTLLLPQYMVKQEVDYQEECEEDVKPDLIPMPAEPQPKQTLNGAELEAGDDEDGATSPKMDLDTRIKLLLKSNKSTLFGKFLNFSMSDSDDDDGDPRGRFRGGFTIRKRKSLCISRSEIWQSENSDVEMSPPRNKMRRRSGDSPPPSPFLDRLKSGEWKPVNGVVDQLPLSDLDEVSDDSEIELPKDRKPDYIQLPPEPHPGPTDGTFHHFPPATPYDSDIMSQYYQPKTTQAYIQQMNSYGIYAPGYPVYQAPPLPPPLPHWNGLNQPPQFDHSQMSYSVAQMSYYNELQNFEPPPPPPPEAPVMSPKTELRLSTKEISTSVLGQLTTDLRQIIRRDCEKRLIEALSFKLFETWCDDEMKLYKELKEQRDRDMKKAAEEKMNGKLEMTITEDALSGFGFRSVSKLPSFKIHKKVVLPPVVPVKEESATVLPEPEDDGEAEGDSDIDVEHKRRPVRRLTLSTDESESDLDYSSDEALPSVTSPRSKKDATNTNAKLAKDLWTESDSEDSASPKPPPDVGDEAEEIEAEKKRLDEMLERKKAAAFEQASPSSRGQGWGEGPYVHIFDHNYAMPWKPSPELPPLPEFKAEVPDVKLTLEPVRVVTSKAKGTARRRSKPEPVPPSKPVKKTPVSFTPRTKEVQKEIMLEFLKSGVDAEDLMYFNFCFNTMKNEGALDRFGPTRPVKWTDHQPTKVLERKRKSKRRVHVTGCARTEGFYHLDEDEKRRHKMQWAKVMTVEYSAPGTLGAVGVTALAHEKHQGKTQIEKSREARSQQRRILTALGNEVTSTSDLLKFNQLKFRKKNLCFRRSTIHDWGLFAAEPIAADEMVIEYVGQTIRPYLADVREQKYEKQGIGSSYLFRIDLENIIDATKCGNLSRFINHSCNPNCYAKVITIQGEKKIVIYSKEAIAVNEEITYDYKFPIEEKKIICLCGTPQCRGTLN